MSQKLATTNLEVQRWNESLKRNFEHKEAVFRRKLPELLATYRGLFVALSGEEIIDKDSDELALAKRVSLLPKDKFILIQQVT